MNRHLLVLIFIALSTLAGPVAYADPECSVRQIAGSWIFATGIGRQALGTPFPPDKDITAIGTMNIKRDGTLSGTFDVTVQDTAFVPGVEYTGEVILNPDCTGTLYFETTLGSTRVDSIAVLSRREILGMSQDPLNLWTYQVRRITPRLVVHAPDRDRD